MFVCPKQCGWNQYEGSLTFCFSLKKKRKKERRGKIRGCNSYRVSDADWFRKRTLWQGKQKLSLKPLGVNGRLIWTISWVRLRLLLNLACQHSIMPNIKRKLVMDLRFSAIFRVEGPGRRQAISAKSCLSTKDVHWIRELFELVPSVPQVYRIAKALCISTAKLSLRSKRYRFPKEALA